MTSKYAKLFTSFDGLSLQANQSQLIYFTVTSRALHFQHRAPKIKVRWAYYMYNVNRSGWGCIWTRKWTKKSSGWLLGPMVSCRFLKNEANSCGCCSGNETNIIQVSIPLDPITLSGGIGSLHVQLKTVPKEVELISGQKKSLHC